MLKARIVTGGRWHDHAAFTQRCRGWLAAAGYAAEAGDLVDLHALPTEAVVVLWTCHGTPDPAIAAGLDVLTEWTAAGGRLLALHGASVAAQWHSAWRTVLGTAFTHHPDATDLVWRPTSLPGNPLAGHPPARWHDEPYRHLPLAKDAEVLLTSDGGDGVHPAAWRRRHGRGTVHYVAGGHDARAWDCPEFQAYFQALLATSWGASLLSIQVASEGGVP